MLSEKSKKFLKGLKAIKYIFLIFGLISFLASMILPLMLVYKIQESIGKAYVQSITRINSVETKTELETSLKNTLLVFLRGFYRYVFNSNGIFLRLYSGFFFAIGIFCLSFFALTKRYLAIIKESGIEKES